MSRRARDVHGAPATVLVLLLFLGAVAGLSGALHFVLSHLAGACR